PVMRGDEIVGMVTRSDFLNALANLSLHAVRYSEDDEHLRGSVIKALSHSPWRPCGLNVTARDGVVTVRGTVASDNARRATIVAAENVPGVRRVEDRLSDSDDAPPEEEYGGG